MKNFRLFLFSLLWGQPEHFLLDQARLGLHRFFREKALPDQIPPWRGRLPKRVAGIEPSSAVGGAR
ncbi:MAG TPA: hypothetical protein VJR29_08100 [bacterium]|nr:hypothetical protein [bacterium]